VSDCSEQWLKLSDEQKNKLRIYFEHHPKITITALKKELGLDKPTKINLEAKNLKGYIGLLIKIPMSD
jgi:hypothetical protein